MRYLSVEVYKQGNYDCTMNGVSVTSDMLMVECEEGNWTDEDIERMRERGDVVNVLVLGKILECPNFSPEGETRHTMFGGNFAWTCDSRFRRKYGHAPIAIHDRIEK